MSQKCIYFLFFLFITTSISAADTIVLTSGERLEGRIIKKNDVSVHLQHPLLGDLHIETNNIQSINQTGPVEEDTSTSENRNLEVSDVEAHWKQTIRLGAGYQTGQINNVDLSTSYHLTRTLDEHEIVLDLSYRFAKTNSTRNANRFSGVWGNRWFHSNSKWDFFTNLQVDSAEFQSWDQRLLGDIGVGYEIDTFENKKEAIGLTARFGGGFRKEYQSENEDLVPEGLLGVEFNWKIANAQKLKTSTTWFPDFENFSNYRIVSKASWSITIDKANSLDFSIGLHHEYDSVVDTGVKNTYLHITSGISYSF